MIEKKPFVNYTLEEDKKKEVVKSVWLNEKDQAELERLKEIFNVKSDSKALKIALKVSLNLIGALFGTTLAKYLFKKDRSKLEDFKDF